MYTDWNYTWLPIWSYEKESGVTEVRRHSWCFVRGALCCLGLCSLFVGSPSVQVAVQLCAVSTTKCRKKNSEFSLLCLSLCEFEFQKILHILPDSDNHKWEWNSSQCSLHPWDEHAMRILPELPMISMIPTHFPCGFNGAMCHVPEEHILKQRHVSHRQRELYWVAILVCKKISYRCSANFSQLFPVWISFWISLDPYGPTTALRSKRLGLTFGACWHLQWCCSTWERRPRAACTCSRGVRKV